MAGEFVVFRVTLFSIILVLLAGCVSSKKPTAEPTHALATPKTSERTKEPVKEPVKEPAKEKPQAAPARVQSSANNDEEIKAITDLAKKNQWDEAETRATVLFEKSPQDPLVVRILGYVKKERQLRREQALEDSIREIDAKNSVFNPTIPGLLKEKKDRGLPANKALRDAVDQLEAVPYVPENFGKTVQEKGRLFDLESKEGKMAKLLSKEISVHVDNLTLEAMLLNIGQAEGINFVVDKTLPALKQTLLVNMDKVRLSEFLRYLSRNLDVQFQVGEDLIWVVDSKDPKRVLEETRVYHLRKGFILPAQFGPTEINRVSETKVLPTGNITTVTENQKIEQFVKDGASTSPSIEEAIKKFFIGTSTSTNAGTNVITGAGPKFQIDRERNVIMAWGTREQLEILDRIIEEFDRPIQQVLIEARFITISQAAFMQLGANWETGRNRLTAVPAPTDFTGLATTQTGLGLQTTFTNVLNRYDLSVTLKALEQGGESQTLSAPRLTLINNLPAHIEDGQVQYYYEEYTVKQQVTDRTTASSLVPIGKPAKLTSGASLDVVASIGGDGKTILLALKPEVKSSVQLVTFATVTDRNDAGNVVGTFDIKLPQYRTQTLSTRVAVKSGQTVVMGGVMEHNKSTFVESVPVLGHIPIIGAAFRTRTEVDSPRYLLVFVKATLLSDSGEFIEYEDQK
ncbi:MAG: type II secretion system protein GspD [Verrucomicrobia bacterium]|nr:type II secretion system protein GspD [Verrucomicrobiota bacterium]